MTKIQAAESGKGWVSVEAYEKTLAQRDELLAALKLARPYLNGEASIKASSAIAKAEGRAQ